MRFRFSVFLIFLFFLGILTLSDENVSASTLSDQKDIRSTSTEFQSENMANLSIQLNQDAVVLNSNMDGIGTIYKNQIIPVTKINDELYEIQGRFDIGTQYDEKLYLKDPVFTEAPSVTGRNDVLKENLIDDSITFNEGVTLSSFFQSTTPVLSIDSCITFSSYYKVQNQIVIQWNNSFYYVNPINHELVEDTQDSTKQEKEITSETEEDNSLSLYSPQESLNTVPSVRSTGTQNGVKKLMDIQNFNASDNYFEVTEVFVTVYDNSDGTLRPVGYLNKGQVYPRIGDFGDWHQIKFGKKYGYVWKAATKVANAYQIKNENKGVNNSGRSFTANTNLTVYDNTGGSLVPFGTIFKGEKYPIIANLGDWIQIDFSGRIGYIYGPAVTVGFSPNDKYFKVLEDIVTIYDNSSGSLVPVGYLTKGQVYPRVSDFGDWHQIKFGNRYGYVWKAATTVDNGNSIKNENRGLLNSDRSFTANQSLTVYDNTGGVLTPFGVINKGEKYAIISYLGDWIQIDFSGRIGYIYGPAVTVGFSPNDKYFKVLEDIVTIYDNSSGSLVPVGYLTKGQVYPRVSDFGDWHQIKFGNRYGYVWKAATTVDNGNSIKNENRGLLNSDRSFTANQSLTVYDNTGGVLTPFGVINKGEKYAIISYLGDWIQIDFSGRIGYIYGPAVTVGFSPNDKYFKVLEDIVTIYDNSSGSLVPVGYLTKGQVYPRVSDFGDWHKIQLSNKYGYIWKAATAVVSNPYIANENRSSVKFGNILFKALQNLSVYDTSSGSLISFGEINMNQTYRAISEYGSDWLKIDFSGRIGYVYKPATEVTYISKTIFLDPGHGGHDSGAADGGYLEKNINLSVAKKVKSILTGRGYTVIMSREDDTYLDLYERAGKANQLNADIFVSIHTNSAGKSSSPVNGIESYYYEYDPEYPSKINVDMHNNPERVSRSITLTKIIQEKLISYTGATNRGVDGASFAVIRESKMPATLIELGFITNNNERQKLVSNSYQDTLARAIADGIVEYLKHY